MLQCSFAVDSLLIRRLGNDEVFDKFAFWKFTSWVYTAGLGLVCCLEHLPMPAKKIVNDKTKIQAVMFLLLECLQVDDTIINAVWVQNGS